MGKKPISRLNTMNLPEGALRDPAHTINRTAVFVPNALTQTTDGKEQWGMRRMCSHFQQSLFESLKADLTGILTLLL